jgi:hypothetical protein
MTWQPACNRKISALRRMVLLSSITMTLKPSTPDAWALGLVACMNHRQKNIVM